MFSLEENRDSKQWFRPLAIFDHDYLECGWFSSVDSFGTFNQHIVANNLRKIKKSNNKKFLWKSLINFCISATLGNF